MSQDTRLPLAEGAPVKRGTRARVIRRLVQALLVVVVAAGMVLAGGNILRATGRQSVATTYSMKVGDLTRSYQTIAPVAPLPKSAPVIIVLGGIAAPLSNEITRDRLVPYVNNNKAELVYPVGYHESWNAVGCCGKAGADHVDDIGFIKALAARVDPGRTRPLDIVGYSNGGRMAYRMACTDPGLFDQIAIVKADPMPGCAVKNPQTILQIAAMDDYAVPYLPSEKGKESPAATVQVARLRAADGCGDAKVSKRFGKMMRYMVWNDCADGTRVAFGVYSVGGHNFPPPTNTQPAAAKVIWAFFTHKDAITPY